MSKFIDEARQLAAQCWCHETTSGREMDSTLAEVVAWKIAAWMDTAASMQAKLDEANAEIARLKSVRLESVAYFDYDEEGGLFLKGRNDAIYHWNEYAEQGWKLKPLYTMKDE